TGVDGLAVLLVRLAVADRGVHADQVTLVDVHEGGDVDVGLGAHEGGHRHGVGDVLALVVLVAAVGHDDEVHGLGAVAVGEDLRVTGQAAEDGAVVVGVEVERHDDSPLYGVRSVPDLICDRAKYSVVFQHHFRISSADRECCACDCGDSPVTKTPESAVLIGMPFQEPFRINPVDPRTPVISSTESALLIDLAVPVVPATCTHVPDPTPALCPQAPQLGLCLIRRGHVTALLRGPLLVDQVGDPAVTTSSCQGGQDQPHQPDPHEDDEHRDGEDDGHGGLLLSLLAEWSEVQPAGDLLVQRWWMSPSPPRHAHAGRWCGSGGAPRQMGVYDGPGNDCGSSAAISAVGGCGRPRGSEPVDRPRSE